ncbi:hypothetical protein CP533_1835 [Ophiocordyceps camponoti-saundersi (nom. inval.)]|nr:hypothetical protein CP533_1835 [Ophiocordyceps camponoti-saundersi (nom. inval.)]
MLVKSVLPLGLIALCVAGSHLDREQTGRIDSLTCGNMKSSTFAPFLNHTVFTARRFNINKPCVTWECVKLVVETFPDEFIKALQPITGKSKYRLIDDITMDLPLISDARYAEFLSWVMSAGLREQSVCWLTSEMNVFPYYEDALGALSSYLIDPALSDDEDMYQRFRTLPVGPLRPNATMCFSADYVYYKQIHLFLPQLQVRDYLQYLPRFKTYDQIRWYTIRWGGLLGRALFEMTQESYSSSDSDRNGASSSLAMEKLLARQASLLTRLHTQALGDETNRDEMNRDQMNRDQTNTDETNVELLRRRLDDVASVAMSRLYAWRFDSVPRRWRCLYTDALVLSTHERLLRDDDDALDFIVETLDRVLITTGAVSDCLDARWVETTMQLLEEKCESEGHVSSTNDSTFSTHEPMPRPEMKPEKKCRRLTGWTLDEFEQYANNDDQGQVRPVVFTDLIQDWPALTDRPWRSPDYLLSKTLGGRRLVPVEIGRSYVDDDWGQELMPFGRFLARHVLRDDDDDDKDDGSKQTGYLAQHNLFHQIPSLRRDVTIPDFCWAHVPPHPTDPSRDHPRLDTPQLNAWFGPAGTITPLHTDGYHNLLCQVVGTKYVRLYPPQATPSMCPRASESGIDMSNTSRLDLGLMEGWDRSPRRDDDDDDDAPSLSSLEGIDYRECILQPGDTLLIPIGWWHYVRSLSISFSLSFWWN